MRFVLLFWAKVEKKRQLAVLIFYFVVSLLAIFKYVRMDFDKFAIEERIIEMLKTVFDPEIPVNVYDLGLIYKIDVEENGMVCIDMTLTAPNCPAADLSNSPHLEKRKK